MERYHATTILSVRKDGNVAIGGDGQVTLGSIVMKSKAAKVRTLADGKVIAGFAGAVSDAFTLFERFEAKLSKYSDNLTRAAVELGKDWRTDKYLRQLEAQLIVCDAETSLLVAGTGEIIESDDGILAIGSGGPYALAAARALILHSKLEPEQVVREAMAIAAELCIYTNTNVVIETL